METIAIMETIAMFHDDGKILPNRIVVKWDGFPEQSIRFTYPINTIVASTFTEKQVDIVYSWVRSIKKDTHEYEFSGVEEERRWLVKDI